MAKNSGIAWTNHTFNPWWGCEKVSAACANCYAAELATRHDDPNLWKGERRRTKGPWKEIIKWDRKAREGGIRERVFVASMADIFEDNPIIEGWREEAFDLLEKLTNLDILLLTKRTKFAADYTLEKYGNEVPKHFWYGTTVENQKCADERINQLLRINAEVRFLSCEPMIGEIDLNLEVNKGINWVICGGESGKKARSLPIKRAVGLKEQCVKNGVAFFFKQGAEHDLNWPHYDEFESFPKKLQIREFPK